MKLSEEQLAAVPAEEKITVKAKVYAFNEPNIGLVKRVRKFYLASPMSTVAGMNLDPDSDEWKKVCDDWNKFCEVIFQNPDDDLSLETLRIEKVGEIVDSFFAPLRTRTQESKSS